MSKPLEVGDLVRVVRGKKCCGDGTKIGFVFQIKGFVTRGRRICSTCGAFIEPNIQALVEPGRSLGYSLYRLKLIPPLSELERTKEEEGVLA